MMETSVEKAQEAGFLAEQDADNLQKVADCLFLSGVSTADKVTAISGRGVGMDAVRQFLRQYGADIKLNILANSYADFVPFELVINLPETMVVNIQLA
ncbi:MAG: hypothetical protein EOO68_29180 [Moraxellaceae bacterium]|nr:MAG: hypothetical protein EOO68_29180 [Moraxellaceae bacterium]